MKNILDDQAKGQVCGIAVGGTFELAAQFVGCSRRTIYNTADRDSEFREKLKQSQCASEIQMLDTIQKAGKETKNVKVALWYLAHKFPERYSRRAHTMPFADVRDLVGQITNAIISGVSDPTLRKSLRMAIRGIVGPYLFKAKEKARAKK